MVVHVVVHVAVHVVALVAPRSDKWSFVGASSQLSANKNNTRNQCFFWSEHLFVRLSSVQRVFSSRRERSETRETRERAAASSSLSLSLSLSVARPWRNEAQTHFGCLRISPRSLVLLLSASNCPSISGVSSSWRRGPRRRGDGGGHHRAGAPAETARV